MTRSHSLVRTVLLALLLAFTPVRGSAGPSPAQAPEATGEERPVKFIKLYVQEWKWTPDEIRVPVGTLLKIEALSYDSSRRFDLKAYKLKVALPQDKPVTFEFVADNGPQQNMMFPRWLRAKRDRLAAEQQASNAN